LIWFDLDGLLVKWIVLLKEAGLPSIQPQKRKIKAVRRLERKDAATYNLSISKNSNYFAERVLVHNCDDLHNIKEAESEVIRTETVRWVREAMSNRLNNMDTDVIVAIMQRSHEADASNTLVELEYEHLMVPMEFDSSRRCETSIGWRDPRTKDGELAWPERFPRRVTDQIKRTIGPYAYSGQYQQTPEVRGGAIIKREWWQDYTTDDGKIPPCQYVVASLDPAYTAKQENDPSGFTVWGVWYDEKGHSRIICLNAWRKRLELHGPHQDRLAGETEAQFVKRTQASWGLVEWVAHSCKRFRVHKLLIESKASGLSVAQEIRRLHAGQGWTVQLVDPKGLDKVTRCHAVVPMFADGQIFLPAYSDGTYREWGQMLVDEFASFPKGATDDLVDSSTQALTHIREIGLAVRKDERAMIERELGRHKGGPPQALYPS
jgi:predicted phage terminase large subunit-like protein